MRQLRDIAVEILSSKTGGKQNIVHVLERQRTHGPGLLLLIERTPGNFDLEMVSLGALLNRGHPEDAKIVDYEKCKQMVLNNDPAKGVAVCLTGLDGTAYTAWMDVS